MATHELTWSTFLREPSSVERHLERGDVLLRRREGESLRLTRESADNAQRQALLVAVRLLTASAGSEKKPIDEAAIAARLPWTRFLPEEDRRQFASEFLNTLEACADLEDFAALGRLVAEWKATAAVHADGLGDKLKSPIKDTGAKVRRP